MKTNTAKKITPVSFALTSTAARVALLTGITAGTVGRDELEAAVLHDTDKRPYRKPVVAGGRRYSSIRNAAVSILRVAGANDNLDYAKRLNALEKRIAWLCNKDQTVGFYWAK